MVSQIPVLFRHSTTTELVLGYVILSLGYRYVRRLASCSAFLHSYIPLKCFNRVWKTEFRHTISLNDPSKCARRKWYLSDNWSAKFWISEFYSTFFTFLLLRCCCFAGDTNNTFVLSRAVSEENFTLRNRIPLDYEKINSYLLTLVATNQDTNKTTTVNVTIIISDVNDNPPIFTSR